MMKGMHWLVMLGFGAVCLCTGAARSATPVDTSGATACAIAGWSADRDPPGLNIRAAPRLDATVVGRVPPPEQQDGESYAAEFRITASLNGWLLVRDVKVVDYASGKGDRLVFAGPGWVFADKVRLAINRPELRRAP
jgi:hypothetical protein